MLHVIAGLSPQGGGPPVALEGLAPAQVEQGLSIEAISTYFAGDDLSRRDRLQAAGVGVTLVGPAKTSLHLAPRTRSTMNRLVARCDIVHIHGMWEQVHHVGARVAHRHRKPYIIRPCGMLDPWSLSQSRWKKRLMLAVRMRTNLRRAAALHFTTATERDLIAPLGIDTDAIVEPNGVNLTEVMQPVSPRLHLGERYPSLAGRPLVLFLGRLHLKKGPDLLLDAFARLLQGWPTDRVRPGLVVVGNDEGGYRATLEAQVQRLNLGADVVFTGLLMGEPKAAALHSADLYCLPSHQENFGISVVEAAAAGLPVLISDQVNIQQEVLAAQAGDVFPLEVDAIVASLRRWLLDEPGRVAAGRRAAAWARQTYNWHDIAGRWAAEHYPRLASGASGR